MDEATFGATFYFPDAHRSKDGMRAPRDPPQVCHLIGRKVPSRSSPQASQRETGSGVAGRPTAALPPRTPLTPHFPPLDWLP